MSEETQKNVESPAEGFFANREAKFNFVFGLVSGVAVTAIVMFAFFFFAFLADDKVTGTNPAANTAQVPAVAAPTETLPTEQPPEEPAFADVRAIDETDRAQGPADAAVQIIEYSDLECPFCGRFYDTMKQVEKEYEGRVQIAFRHFPLSFHYEADKAAQAVECAGDQGKFWEMHDKIFEAQGTADFNEAGWEKFAKQLGLQPVTFKSCLNEGKYAQKVQDHIAEASLLGVSGTPTAFINGRFVRGAVPYAQVKAIIDEELQK